MSDRAKENGQPPLGVFFTQTDGQVRPDDKITALAARGEKSLAVRELVPLGSVEEVKRFLTGISLFDRINGRRQPVDRPPSYTQERIEAICEALSKVFLTQVPQEKLGQPSQVVLKVGPEFKESELRLGYGAIFVGRGSTFATPETKTRLEGLDPIDLQDREEIARLLEIIEKEKGMERITDFSLQEISLDQSVSRVHGMVVVLPEHRGQSERAFYLDLHSIYKSKVNGQLVAPGQPVDIKNGDTILLASQGSLPFDIRLAVSPLTSQESLVAPPAEI